jgi:hypothetical protein
MSPRKGVRQLLSADGGVWSLNIAIVIASALLLLGPVQDLPAFDAGLRLPWWGLALGFLAAERCVVHLHFRRSAHSFSLGDLPLVFGLLSAPMVAGAAAIGFQLDPTLTPNRAKALLRDSDRPLSDSIDELNLADAARRFLADGSKVANQGLTPNQFIDPATGDVDYTRSSWSRSSWSTSWTK